MFTPEFIFDVVLLQSRSRGPTTGIVQIEIGTGSILVQFDDVKSQRV